MFGSSQVDGSSVINDVIQEHPTTAAVFNYFGIDSCCSAQSTIAAAAENEFVDVDSLVAALRAAIRYEAAVGTITSYEKRRAASATFDAHANEIRA